VVDRPHVSVIGVYYNTSQRENFGSLPLIHLGQLSLAVTDPGLVSVIIKNGKTGWERVFFVSPGQVGLLSDVPEAGDYEIHVEGTVELSGQYCYNGKSRFEVGTGDAFFPDAIHLCTVNANVSVGLIVGLVVAGVAVVAGVIVGIVLWRRGFCRSCVHRGEKTVELLKEGPISYDPEKLL
jgi:hypothetical protein